MSKFLEIEGACTHNLKDVSVKIPKNKMTVLTGVSGSGKSSLAFNTVYAEGQRKYLESLSTYARMFIGGTNEETKVREIRGLSPTISIDQKTVSHNPRSTVGTITEIYDFYRLMYLHVGVRSCPTHGVPLQKSSVEDVVAHVGALPAGTRFYVLAPFPEHKGAFGAFEEARKATADAGFVRFTVGGQQFSLSDPAPAKFPKDDHPWIVVDRLAAADYARDEGARKRLVDSLLLAWQAGREMAAIRLHEGGATTKFPHADACPECGYKPGELSLSHFSFNSHHGACPECHGLGVKTSFLESNVTNPDLTVGEGALLPWSQSGYHVSLLEALCAKYGIPSDVPYRKLKPEHRKTLMGGIDGASLEIRYLFDGKWRAVKANYKGLLPYLEEKYQETDNEAVFKRVAQFATEVACPSCQGYRLKPESLQVRVGGLHIGELANLSVGKSVAFFDALKLGREGQQVAKNVLKNVRERLSFLQGVGLDYMTLARRANTISGGEGQRIRLATQIGTQLEGIIYVLDEPSIGLHPRDNDLLIENLRRLTDVGNTLVVVEHDEDVMRASDCILDIGPGAGVHGGTVVFQGTFDEIVKDKNSDTGLYLSGQKSVELPANERAPAGFILVRGAHENNLRDVDVDVPLGLLTVVTGVSGSGKSSLVNKTLAPFLLWKLNHASPMTPKCASIKGWDKLDKAVIVDQMPIGRTPRSNPATYTGVFALIRDVFTASPEAKKRGYGAGHFSFNTREGRCNACEGDGVKKIEMHFLPDVYVTCETCQGKRYNHQVLDVKYRGKSIADVLDMTVETALEFFANHPRVVKILDTVNDVGLGYVRLGQSATTLSGGESQRVKLATELAKRSTSKTVYILDEPTTGLHFSDIQKLLNILDRLVEKGNTVLMIEHNLDCIANADWIIDIGPEGGDAGGNLMYAGPRDGLTKVKGSHTAKALERFLGRKAKVAAPAKPAKKTK